MVKVWPGCFWAALPFLLARVLTCLSFHWAMPASHLILPCSPRRLAERAGVLHHDWWVRSRGRRRCGYGGRDAAAFRLASQHSQRRQPSPKHPRGVLRHVSWGQGAVGRRLGRPGRDRAARDRRGCSAAREAPGMCWGGSWPWEGGAAERLATCAHQSRWRKWQEGFCR